MSQPLLCKRLHSYAHSRLDYCNALLAEILQTLDNTATRSVSAARRRTHVSPIQKLPLASDVSDDRFQDCILVLECIRSDALAYLQELCVRGRRRLQSASTGSLSTCQESVHTTISITRADRVKQSPMHWSLFSWTQ